MTSTTWRPGAARPGGSAWHSMIFDVQSIAVTASVSTAHDAGNAVDDEEDADRNGHDRKDRRAGPYETIPQVGQVCFGLPGTPGEVQEDQADGGRFPRMELLQAGSELLGDP